MFLLFVECELGGQGQGGGIGRVSGGEWIILFIDLFFSFFILSEWRPLEIFPPRSSGFSFSFSFYSVSVVKRFK